MQISWEYELPSCLDLRCLPTPLYPSMRPPLTGIFWLPQNRPRFRAVPIGAHILIVLLLAAFLVQQAIGVRQTINSLGAIPANLLHPHRLFSVSLGQLVPGCLTLLTYAFLHGSWIHLVTNLIS